MARGASRGAAYACAGAVLCVLMPLTVTPRADAAGPADAGSARRAEPVAVSIPAYAGAQRLKARIPSGGLVGYRLPTLPAGATRLLGDWDGDGAETSGTFLDGQWQLWDRIVRLGSARPTVAFGVPGDRPVTGDWNGDGVTDLGLVRGSEWLLTLEPAADRRLCARGLARRHLRRSHRRPGHRRLGRRRHHGSRHGPGQAVAVGAVRGRPGRSDLGLVRRPGGPAGGG